MDSDIRIGTSGWVYGHWKGLYYPENLPQKDWFGHYVRDFDTVEINNTFYRLPNPETFENWGKVAPGGFRFTFKASRYITHIKRLRDPQGSLALFLDRARLAGPALGPILFQLPPRWKADPQRLEEFLQALPDDLVHVFEFRDESWHQPPIRDLLTRYRVSFCIHDHHPSVSPDWVTSETVYLRFHGSGETPYNGSYSQEQLRREAQRIAAWRREGKRIYAYFNNDIGGHAVHNALELKKMLA